MMSFHLAEYYFRQQNYTKATSIIETVNIENLSNKEIANMKFHHGVCLFYPKQFDGPNPCLMPSAQMKDDPNYIDANYYYGFIAFYDKQYREALDAFTIVEDRKATMARLYLII